MSGYTFGVPHVMNSADSRARAPKTLVVAAAAAVLAGIGGAGLYVALGRAPAPAVPPPRPGRVLSVADAVKELDLVQPTRPKHAEDFALPLADGTRFRLADQRGKVVLVNFWATWCPPCREEMPAMVRLWQRQKEHGFVLVAVSVDADPKVVNPYLAKHKLSFPVALDPKLDLGNAYGVRALPSSFILDRDGYVTALALGPRRWDGDASLSLFEGLLRSP